MRGLTPREYAELRDLAAGPDGESTEFADAETESVLNALVEQGRVSFRVEPGDDPTHEWAVWSLTPQGRKALELLQSLPKSAIRP